MPHSRSSSPAWPRRRSRKLLVPALLALCAAAAAAQGQGRLATNAGALVAFPVFFHGKQVAIRHAVTESGELSQLAGTTKPVFVYWRERRARSEGEIRGEFFDLGRMQDGDPRFASYDFSAVTAAATNGRWPGRDRVFVILGATILESPAPTTASLRAIAMNPAAFENRGVTLTGRFRGRNLYGDLPQALNRGKWDFILQAADAALWVTGARPKGKGFDLDPGARVDTGRWLEVKGTIRRDGDLVWIEATSIQLSTPPAESPVEVSVPVAAPEPPPTVIFSAPINDDTDVPLNSTVRIQFSRDMDGPSFRGRVRARYIGRVPPGATPPVPPDFTMAYDPGTRSLEIKFASPLERFQTVAVDLLEGITARGGIAMAPWTLTFSTGS